MNLALGQELLKVMESGHVIHRWQHSDAEYQLAKRPDGHWSIESRVAGFDDGEWRIMVGGTIADEMAMLAALERDHQYRLDCIG